MVDEVDLRSLMRQASAGQPDAWEVLDRRAYPRLFSYARRRLPSDDAADDAHPPEMISGRRIRRRNKARGMSSSEV